MKSASPKSTCRRTPKGFPRPAALACLRAWHAGLSSREAVDQYLEGSRKAGESSRSVITAIRKELAQFARVRQRSDLARLFELPAADRAKNAREVADAVETLASLPLPSSQSPTRSMAGFRFARCMGCVHTASAPWRT